MCWEVKDGLICPASGCSGVYPCGIYLKSSSASVLTHTQTLYPMCPASQSAGLINLFSPPDPGELLKRALPLAGGHQMPALNYSSLRLLGESERGREMNG